MQQLSTRRNDCLTSLLNSSNTVTRGSDFEKRSASRRPVHENVSLTLLVIAFQGSDL